MRYPKEIVNQEPLKKKISIPTLLLYIPSKHKKIVEVLYFFSKLWVFFFMIFAYLKKKEILVYTLFRKK